MDNIACSLLSDELLDDSFSSTFGMDAYSEQLLRNFVEDVQSKIAEGSEPIGTESSTFKKVSKYIKDIFEEEVDPTKLDSDLLSIWNEKLNASRSLSNNDKIQDLEIQEVPNLTNSLSDIFKDEVDWRNFLQSSKRRIILSTIISPLSNSSIVDNYDLNNSMIGTQEFLATRLSRYLGLEPKPIYNGTLFNKDNYDELIKQAKLKFSTFFHNGKYSFNGNRSNRNAFNDYLLLTNFDAYITKFLGKTVAIDPNLVGVRQLPKQGLKYTQDGESIKQEWDDEKAGDMKLNTSSYVRDYVTSLEEMTPDRISTGRYLMINEFNNLVTFIKDKANLAQLANIREYPDIVVKEIFDEMARNPRKYFTGKHKLLENAFFTIYHNVFNINTNSLFSTYNASTTSKRNDLYSMICNQISKTSAANYIQTYYNNQKEVKAYVVDFLTSEAISTNKSELNRSVALGIATLSDEAKRDLFNQFQVKFYNGNNRLASENDKIQYVEFLVGGIKCKSDLKNSTISLSDAATDTKFNGYVPKAHIKNLINKLIRRSYSDDFYDSMLKAATSSEKDALLRYAANIFLSAKLSGLDRATINSKLVTDTDRFSGYNETFKVLRPDGYNKSLDAVDLLAKAISYENKEISKSYVKNSLGAFLSKTSLTSLGLDDYIQFGKNYKIAKEQGNKYPLYYNLFTNSQMSGSPLSLANFFKTEVVNFDGDTKQIKELSAADLSYEAFVFGYLINKKQGKGDNKGIIQIQSNEYSDKSKISGKIVDLFQRIKYVAGGFSINKSLGEMTDKEISDLYYHSVSNQLRRLSETIKRDYDTLFGILHDLYGDRFKVKNTLEEYKKELPKLSDDAVHTAVIAAQKQGIKLEIIPEIHFTGKEGKRQFNKLLDFIMTGVFSYPKMFKDRMYNLDKDYAEKLRSLNVRFETILDNGEYNKALMNNIDKSEDQEEYITSILDKESFDKISKKYGGKTFEKIWIDNRFNELRTYIAFDKDGNIIEDPSVSLNNAAKVVINPELHRFRMLNNLISDNYNLAITGMPFLHPSKVTAKDWSEIGLEEGARTVSYNKRGVIHGATIHPEAKNKMDGIPQVYNLAVIKDLESLNMGLTGDNGDATQADGAIYRTGSIALWEKASIPELKGSYYQSKPIGYSYNPDHLSSTLLKCAMFTISNAVVRNSITNRIKMDNVLRNMMDRPWLVPNLDLTDELSGREFAYTNPESNLSSYFVVSDLEKTESRIFNNSIDNVYTGTVTEYNIETGEMIDSTIRSFSINSNYDLYKIMGGGYSGYRKLVKKNIGGKTKEVGEFIHDESSWENLAEIGNNINIESDSAEIEEYNDFIDEGLLIGKSKLFVPESLEIKDVKVSNNNIIPTKYLKFRSGSTPYFQPMKYSDVHYLANASAVKNGAANVNPASLYYNSVATRISPNDRLIFGHPTLGKTQAEKMGYDILDFDTFIRNENNKYIRDNALEGESRGDTLKRIGETPEYQQFVYNKLKEALATNRQIFFSKTALLRALNNPAINVDGIKLDKLITMSEEDFVRRDLQRGAPDEVATRDWKHNLDNEINTYLSNNDVEVIDATGHNLYEYLGSSLTSIELDPSYIGLQLIAEHDIEDDEVSEMTQVISALIQNTYTADLAIKVLQDIGDSIANELSLYNRWDIQTPEGRAEVNRILGKALVRVFANREGQEISLASAYLDNIKDELYNSKLSAELIPNIPFDDNNILGMFETSFANGFNRDIIKRKFPGMAAVLNPSQDIFTLYDYNGQVITSADFMKLGAKEQIQTLRDLLTRLDVEVPVSEIREGDWVEYNGEVKQVGILSKATSDGITLREIRKLRGQTIKKLGSKGRNLRAQNYKVQVIDPEKLNTPDVNFDLFDLDIVMFSHNLYRFMDLQSRVSKGEELVDNDLLDYEEYSETFNELRSYIDSVYYNKNGNPIARWDVYLRNWNSTKGEPKDKRIHREFGRYIIEYIQYEMKNLSEGKFHIPRAYRSGEDAYAMVLSEYIPNELAVGKPWANKFMLEVGDNLADVNADFFYNKLKARRNSPLAKQDTNFYFCANNYVLNFGNQHIIDNLSIRKGYKVELINNELDLIANQKGIVRRINSEVYYPVNDNMKFYRITTPDNQVTEMVIDYTLDDAINIWNSHSFYTNTINYPTTGESDLEDLQKLLILDSEINDLEIDLSNINEIAKSYQDAQKVANKIEADMRKQAAKMYRSFNEALKAIAARIPAQSMQSFMNMKIVGFTEVDSNLAYVPVNMLMYEGSDFKLKFLV